MHPGLCKVLHVGLLCRLRRLRKAQTDVRQRCKAVQILQ